MPETWLRKSSVVKSGQGLVQKWGRYCFKTPKYILELHFQVGQVKNSEANNLHLQPILGGTLLTFMALKKEKPSNWSASVWKKHNCYLFLFSGAKSWISSRYHRNINSWHPDVVVIVELSTLPQISLVVVMKWVVYKQIKSRVLKKKGNVEIVGLFDSL